MNLSLGINDDIQQTFHRYETFKKKSKPKNFESVFLGEYSSCNLYFKNIENSSQNQFNYNSNNNTNNNADFFGFSGNSQQNSNNNQNQVQNQQNDDPGKKYAQELNDIFG